MKTDVAIVGGGLSGLALAARLHAADVDFRLFEARPRLGGRIDVLATPAGAVDLGPSWFWPGQPRIATLVEGLGLRAFPQYSHGGACFEACPMVRLLPGLTGADPGSVTQGLRALARGQSGPAETVAWVGACGRSGVCVSACPERDKGLDAMLLVRDGDGHTGYREGSTCVDDAVDAFLLDGVLPEPGTDCD